VEEEAEVEEEDEADALVVETEMIDEISVRMQGVTKNYIDVIIEEEGGLEVYGNIWHAGVEPERKNMGCNTFN